MASSDPHLVQLEKENNRAEESKKPCNGETSYSCHLPTSAALIIGLLLHYISFELLRKAVERSSEKRRDRVHCLALGLTLVGIFG
jgi:hypothetical protein